MCKDSANRGQNKTNSFVFYAEVPPFLWKDSESREQNKKMGLHIFFVLPRRILSYQKIVQDERFCKKQAGLFFQRPKCRLSYGKIVQGGVFFTCIF